MFVLVTIAYCVCSQTSSATIKYCDLYKVIMGSQVGGKEGGKDGGGGGRKDIIVGKHINIILARFHLACFQYKFTYKYWYILGVVGVSIGMGG